MGLWLKEVPESKSPFGNEFKIPKERLTKVHCLVRNQQILTRFERQNGISYSTSI